MYRNRQSMGFITEALAIGTAVYKAVKDKQAPQSGGDVFAGITNPGQPTEGARLIVSDATAAELLSLRTMMCEDGGRMAVDRKDALGIAWYVSGGADGVVTTNCGRALVIAFNSLVDAIRTRLAAQGGGGVPSQPDYTLPGIDVTVPRSTANAGMVAVLGFGLALWALSGRKGRR